MAVDTAPELRFGVCREELISLAGLALAARLVKIRGAGGSAGEPGAHQAAPARMPGRADAAVADLQPERVRGPHLNEVEGLWAVPDSRRLGEFLGRTTAGALAGLEECARIISWRLVPQLMRHCRKN